MRSGEIPRILTGKGRCHDTHALDAVVGAIDIAICVELDSLGPASLAERSWGKLFLPGGNRIHDCRTRFR